jgi:hypothetical protein
MRPRSPRPKGSLTAFSGLISSPDAICAPAQEGRLGPGEGGTLVERAVDLPGQLTGGRIAAAQGLGLAEDPYLEQSLRQEAEQDWGKGPAKGTSVSALPPLAPRNHLDTFEG